MNDLLHDRTSEEDDDLEQRLRDALRRQATLATASPDARTQVRLRVDQRRAGRRVRARLGAAAAAAAAVGGGLWLQSGSPVTVGVTAEGGDGSAPLPAVTEPAPASDPARTAAGPLPRLALDREGLVVDEAQEYASDPSIGSDGTYRQVFRGASSGPAGPSFTIISVPPGAAFGIGEDSPVEVTEQVEVQGRVGYLVEGDSLTPSLGWRLDDGSAVYIEAITMPGDALVELANALRPRPGGAGWDVSGSAVPQVVEGPLSWAGAVTSSIEYRSGGEPAAAVRLFTGDDVRFEDFLLDRADAAVTLAPIEIRGHDGVLFGTGGSFVAVWQDDGFYGEVVVHGTSEAEALATIATLHEVTG